MNKFRIRRTETLLLGMILLCLVVFFKGFLISTFEKAWDKVVEPTQTEQTFEEWMNMESPDWD